MSISVHLLSVSSSVTQAHCIPWRNGSHLVTEDFVKLLRGVTDRLVYQLVFIKDIQLFHTKHKTRVLITSQNNIFFHKKGEKRNKLNTRESFYSKDLKCLQPSIMQSSILK